MNGYFKGKSSEPNDNYWMRLSKILWFVNGEQITYLQKQKAEAILICETLTNNYILQCPRSIIILSLFVNDCLCEARRSAIFTQERSQEGQKRWFHLQMTRILFTAKLNTVGWHNCACQQTIICRKLFAGHTVGSLPMKRKKNLQRMMTAFVCQANYCSIIWASLGNLDTKVSFSSRSRAWDPKMWLSLWG